MLPHRCGTSHHIGGGGGGGGVDSVRHCGTASESNTTRTAAETGAPRIRPGVKPGF